MNRETEEWSTAPKPSWVHLPISDNPNPTILEFLTQRFPKVSREIWIERIQQEKVHFDTGEPVRLDSPYRGNTKVRYFREVRKEPVVPFQEKILFENDHILVACKPHFLPVTPTGPYVNQCLLYRLRKRSGMEDLVPVHRLDRETSGVVLFSKNRESRGLYFDLFRENRVEKQYEAVGTLSDNMKESEWSVESRIVRGDPWFLSKEEEGEPNAFTRIHLLEKKEGLGYFQLNPKTGKKHQLRLHMRKIGSGIVNDTFYPVVLSVEEGMNYSKPLQLLAKRIRFIDPVTFTQVDFASSRTLIW